MEKGGESMRRRAPMEAYVEVYIPEKAALIFWDLCPNMYIPTISEFLSYLAKKMTSFQNENSID